MVDMVVFVRRLGDGGFDGIKRRVADGHARMMVDEVMAAVAYWERWLIVRFGYLTGVRKWRICSCTRPYLGSPGVD